MRDPSLKLRQAYYALINGNVSYGGVVVPLFDMIAPKGQTRPFIVFTDQTNVEDGCKTNKSTESTVLIEVETGFDNSYGGQEMADSIGDDVLELLTIPLDLTPDFVDVHGSIIDNITTFKSEDGRGNLNVVKQIRLRHKIFVR